LGFIASEIAVGCGSVATMLTIVDVVLFGALGNHDDPENRNYPTFNMNGEPLRAPERPPPHHVTGEE
jgi:hypothetical protein